MTLEQLTEQIRQCSKCPLREHATQPVPGVGDAGATYLLIGEAPGREEDADGVPFIGKAGKRLGQLMELAGIDPNDCYITNTCKCRPPKNRNPRKAEQRLCEGWLQQEIKLVKPKYIITLGAVPLALFSKYGIKQMHGTMFYYQLNGRGVDIIAQYHPAAVLHQPRLWATMLDDWENIPERVEASFTVVDKLDLSSCEYYGFDTENDNVGKLGTWSVAGRDKKGKMCVQSYFGKNPAYKFPPTAVIQNAKWDLRVLKNNGMKPPEHYVDTMIAAYCLGFGHQDSKASTFNEDTGIVGGLGLKYLARRHLGMAMNTWNQIADQPEMMLEYNAKDSVAALLLWEKWLPDIPQHFWDIDMPLLPVIMAMEDRGIAIEPAMLGEFDKYLDKAIKEIDLPLNANAPAEIQSYVYGELGIEPWKFTESGQPSTEKEVLESIDDPTVRKILEYKRLFKEKGTYVESYIERMDLEGRVHPEFKQCRTATGRLSSARPNLQNVPIEGAQGRLRELFIAPEGKKLIRLDFKQMELRVFAALTQDEAMLKAFAEGKDIHQETADALHIDRSHGRNVNFLMLFGGGAWKISHEFGVPIDEAKRMIQKYYGQFPGIPRYFKEMKEKLEAERRAYTYFGRVRRLDALYAEDWRVKDQGLREGFNMPIQGTAAEIVKLVMIDLHHKHSAPILIQVHDELLFEVNANEADEYARWLWEYVPTLVEIEGVRFPVDVGVGNNWREAKK